MIGENNYYIGIDIGYYSTKAAYMDPHTRKPVIMDRSGGFGLPYFPSSITYMAEDRTWLIGEEVGEVMDESALVHIDSILEWQSRHVSLQVDDQVYDRSDLMARFISEVASHIWQVNPKAVIKGLTVAMSDMAADEAKLAEKIVAQMKINKNGICFIRSYEGSVAYMAEQVKTSWKRMTVLDFGHMSMRWYTVENSNELHVLPVGLSDSVEGAAVLDSIREGFVKLFADNCAGSALTKSERRAIGRLAVSYFPYVFRNYREGKGLKVSFSFAFPPFQAVMTKEALAEMIGQYEERLRRALSVHESSQVFVTGNGLRMEWPAQLLSEAGWQIAGNDSDAAVKGAAMIAAGVPRQVNRKGFLKNDYGLVDSQDDFHIIAAKGRPHCHTFKPVRLVVSADEEKIVLCTRKSDGSIEMVQSIELRPSEDIKIRNVVLDLSFDQALNPYVAVTEAPL